MFGSPSRKPWRRAAKTRVEVTAVATAVVGMDTTSRAGAVFLLRRGERLAVAPTLHERLRERRRTTIDQARFQIGRLRAVRFGVLAAAAWLGAASFVSAPKDHNSDRHRGRPHSDHVERWHWGIVREANRGAHDRWDGKRDRAHPAGDTGGVRAPRAAQAQVYRGVTQTVIAMSQEVTVG